MSDKSDMGEKSSITIKDIRDHAWDYFSVHAEQRLKMFHFFIIFQTGLVAAILLTTRLGAMPTKIFSLIGLLMALLSFVFWKLDQRTKGMIKSSEEILKLYEEEIVGAFDDKRFTALPFTGDPQNKGEVGLSPFGTLSYSKCFGVVFLTFGIMGIGTFIWFVFF